MKSPAALGAAFCLTVGALSAARGDERPYVPDISTFMQIGGAYPAGITWDGQTVFFTSSMSGAYQVYRLTPEGWPYQLSMFPDGIDYFRPSYGGDRAIVGASEGGSEQSQIYLMDTQTGRLEQLTGFENVQVGNVLWAPDDRRIYYRSNQENGRDFCIYRMDLESRASEPIFGGQEEVRGYNVIADVSGDGRWMIIDHRTSNTNSNLYLLDLASGGYRPLTRDDRDVRYVSPWMMPDGRTIWLVCNDNPERISRVARMTVDSPEVTFVDDGWIDPRWEVSGIGFSRDYRYMYAHVNEEGYLRLRMREVATGEVLPAPPLEGMVDWAEFDRRADVLIGFSGPTRASDVWHWSPSTGRLRQLTFAAYAGIDRELFSEPRLIHYPSFDGLRIPAFLYLPRDYREGEPIPFILHAHGGPEGQFQPYFRRNIQYLLLNGYGLLAPNPRGSSGYGHHYMSLDDYRKREDSLRDYRAAVDWLVERGFTKPGQLAIRGGSYGGYVVLGMITSYPELFAAAVSDVGIANFETFLRNTRPYRRALREAEYGPLSDVEFLRSISPIHRADRIRTPLLVVHGANDPRVPVDEARQIIRAIKSQGGQVDSLIFLDEGHGAAKRANTIAEYRKQVAFFDQYLR